MVRAQRNLIWALAIIGALAVLVAYVASPSGQHGMIPAHDSPIVVSDGSIHASAKGWFHFFHQVTSQDVEGYQATTKYSDRIHLRGFDRGDYPLDFSGLSGWRVDLLTTSVASGTGYLCSSQKCDIGSLDPDKEVYFYVVNNSHLKPSTFHAGLTYSDGSAGCEKVGSDGESICIHITGVKVTTGDGVSHSYRCATNKGNCTVTIGDPAVDPKLPGQVP